MPEIVHEIVHKDGLNENDLDKIIKLKEMFEELTKMNEEDKRRYLLRFPEIAKKLKFS